MIKGDIITVDDVNAVLTKSQELARSISNSREVTGELILAAIANASALTDDHTAMYFLNIMKGAVEALEVLPYERVKNKNYKRYDRQSYRSDKFKDRINEKELSFDEYQEWQQEASATRAEYLRGTLSAEEFGKVINKLG